MCFQKIDCGSDALGRNIDCTKFIIEDFDRCNYVERIYTASNDLTFVQLNVQGITHKQAKIVDLVENCVKGKDVDVILLCET